MAATLKFVDGSPIRTALNQASSIIEVALRSPAKAFLRKKYNLVELCTSLHGFGIGKRFTRSIWDLYQPETYITVSRMTIRRLDPHLKRAKIYGFYTHKGVTDTQERVIRSPLKRQWSVHQSNPLVKFPDVGLPEPVAVAVAKPVQKK